MRSPRAFLVTSLVLLSSYLIVSSSACSDPNSGPSEAPRVCLDGGVDESCTPAYEPTWDAIYTNTLQRSCTLSGVSCHAATGKQGGVDLSAIDIGYSTITKAKVRPGDPACSILVNRVMSTTGNTRMPPGRSLSQGEQCAIVKWIAAGAAR